MGDTATVTRTSVHRREPALLAEYRAARAEQDIRFGDATGGGIGSSDTHTEEYRRYFGLGHFSGMGAEQRVTYRSWLEQAGRERAAERALAEEPTEPAPVLTEWDINPVSDADRAEWARIVVRDVTEDRPRVTAEDAFRMSGAELAILVQSGDTVAAGEVARRVARRGVKAQRIRAAGYVR